MTAEIRWALMAVAAFFAAGFLIGRLQPPATPTRFAIPALLEGGVRFNQEHRI